MNILPGNMRFGAGQPVKRLEDQRLVTGKGLFIDDKPEDGALWLHVLRSPHAHAKIVSIDSQAAREMPGVEAVYSGADLIADDIGTIPTLSIFKRPDGSPMTVPPRRLLAHETVRFAGEPVAAVVATSRVEPGVCDWTCRISRPDFLSISAMVERGSIAEGTSRWLVRSSETTCAALAKAASTAAASP